MFKRVPFIEQIEDSECGLACTAMLLGYYGHSITLHEIREQFGISKGGSSLAHLAQIGAHYCMKSKGLKTDFAGLASVPLPAIAHWDQKHFIVLEKVTNRGVYIVDPSYGRRRLTIREATQHYSGFILYMTPEKGFIKKKAENKWSFFLQFAIKQPKWLLSIFMVSLLLQGLGIVIPWITTWVTDNILIPRQGQYLPVVGFGLLFLFVFYELFTTLRGYLLVRLQTAMDLDMMEAFISRLFKLPYSFFESRTGGDLLFRTNANLYIRQILSNRLITLLIDFILLFSYAGLMLYQSRMMGLIVIGIGAFVFMMLLVTTAVTKRFTSQDISAQTKTQSFLTECIYGISDIKLLGAENQTFAHWNRLFRHQLSTTQKRSIWMVLLDSFSGGIQFITPFLLLWAGSFFVVRGDMTLGGLLGFNALASAFMIPIVSLGSGYTQILSVGSYLQRIHDVVAATPEQSNNEQKVESLLGKINMKNVSFRYNVFSENVIDNVSLTINPGETVAIVGPSGSGKSTLAKLLLGFYRQTNGDITYDDIPLEALDFTSLRQNIGAVLQETKLFQRTVEDNIRMLNPEIPFEQVHAAALQANIHEEIMKMPLGYHTLISESGSNLSGGQRQRLLLARALVNHPHIIILDEATSALDNLSESAIHKAISSLQCTRIIIAHRLSTIVNADRIIVMDQGQFVETGTHEELLTQSGLYHQLYIKEEQRNEVAV